LASVSGGVTISTSTAVAGFLVYSITTAGASDTITFE
jgi:hypothetical protein